MEDVLSREMRSTDDELFRRARTNAILLNGERNRIDGDAIRREECVFLRRTVSEGFGGGGGEWRRHKKNQSEKREAETHAEK